MIKWQKSSFSGDGDGNECVELAYADASLLLREGDDLRRILRVAPSSIAAVVQWQKSSFSNGNDGANCVEVAASEGELLLRESEDPTRTLPLTPTTLAALLHRIRSS
ncbi:DUF397 domain-containing protein [Streptomyces prunicolor]|uniref:DUF397 domain-containing protein n=1 Tax=Streptomyces prunicolor TaxID=67348 RepID=A0ABU4F581_9ACTN|nr:DUF397 domain-containing protein [Streptomyces prunicolor]MDV7215744.1 DUF397 domain-containing protein [Streptomyces prunicolor]